MIIALLFLILVAILFPGALRFLFWAILVCFALSQLHTARAEPRNHQSSIERNAALSFVTPSLIDSFASSGSAAIFCASADSLSEMFRSRGLGYHL
jgi:hypothetical protein